MDKKIRIVTANRRRKFEKVFLVFAFTQFVTLRIKSSNNREVSRCCRWCNSYLLSYIRMLLLFQIIHISYVIMFLNWYKFKMLQPFRLPFYRILPFLEFEIWPNNISLRVSFEHALFLFAWIRITDTCLLLFYFEP